MSSKPQEVPEDRHRRLLNEFLREADRHVKEAEQERAWGPIHIVLYPENGLIAEFHHWREKRRK